MCGLKPGIDFQKTVLKLRAHFSDKDIASLTSLCAPCSESMVGELAAGKYDPNHPVGEAIYVLFCELFTPLGANGGARPLWVKPPDKNPVNRGE